MENNNYNDKDFFEEEVVGLYKYLLCCINTITNDRLLSADIVQETMETAWAKLELIKKYNNLKHSLLAIAKNKLMNYYRKNKVEINAMSLSEDILFEQAEEDLVTRLLQEEDQRKLLTALSQLRDEYTRIILMYYFYEIPLCDVSKILDINYNTIVSWHRRALKGLSELLTD